VGKFRVNAHNRNEAYCTIDGIPVDILITGLAQNRAVCTPLHACALMIWCIAKPLHKAMLVGTGYCKDRISR